MQRARLHTSNTPIHILNFQTLNFQEAVISTFLLLLWSLKIRHPMGNIVGKMSCGLLQNLYQYFVNKTPLKGVRFYHIDLEYTSVHTFMTSTHTHTI